MPLRVYVADDHPLLRKGIIDLLKSTEGLECIGDAPNGKVALAEIPILSPDIAILDFEMPYYNGLEVAQTILKQGVETLFIILTLHKEKELLSQALKAGVKGYLLKESSEQVIIDCIQKVAEGKTYLDPLISQLLMSDMRNNQGILGNLSNHEVDILRLISRHKTTTEIAEMLFISPKTVSNHRSNISKKLNLSGVQNGLLKWAIEHKEILE